MVGSQASAGNTGPQTDPPRVHQSWPDNRVLRHKWRTGVFAVKVWEGSSREKVSGLLIMGSVIQNWLRQGTLSSLACQLQLPASGKQTLLYILECPPAFPFKNFYLAIILRLILLAKIYFRLWNAKRSMFWNNHLFHVDFGWVWSVELSRGNEIGRASCRERV